MSQYKVTIAIPVYNVAPYVERSLLSALSQSFQNIEFLIIDDRGTDNSMEIVRQIVSTHPRGKDVRIIDHRINRGVGQARNTAIEQAQGEYLYFMDSDDEIMPDCIQALYDAMTETPVDFIAASHIFIRDNQPIRESVLPNRILNGTYELWQYQTSTEQPISIVTWNKLYKLKFLKKKHIQCAPHHRNEDEIFTTQVWCEARSCRLLSNITYKYRLISTSTMGQIKQQGFTYTIANQYQEIFAFKKQYFAQFAHTAFFSFCTNDFLRTLLLMKLAVSNSSSLTQKEKYFFIRKYSDFTQYPVSKAKLTGRARLVYTIGKLPANIQLWICHSILNLISIKHYCLKFTKAS